MAGFFLISFLMLSGRALYAQVDSLILVRAYPVEAQQVFVDALDHLYLLDQTNQLTRLEADGHNRFWFQDVKLGNLEIVDLSDPLNILLYYPEFQEIVLLDRTLAEVSRLQLISFGLFSIEAVGYSSDNRIWLYDPMSGTLKKIDTEGKVAAESQILPPLIGRQIHPLRIMERDQRVYVQCEEAGILVFDAFGGYVERLPWPTGQDFQVANGRFFGCSEFICRVMDSFSRREQRFELPQQFGPARSVQLRQGVLYALYPGTLRVFRIHK